MTRRKRGITGGDIKRKRPHHVVLPTERVQGLRNNGLIFCADGVYRRHRSPILCAPTATTSWCFASPNQGRGDICRALRSEAVGGDPADLIKRRNAGGVPALRGWRGDSRDVYGCHDPFASWRCDFSSAALLTCSIRRDDYDFVVSCVVKWKTRRLDAFCDNCEKASYEGLLGHRLQTIGRPMEQNRIRVTRIAPIDRALLKPRAGSLTLLTRPGVPECYVRTIVDHRGAGKRSTASPRGC
jgi:hypothetical protein